MFDQPSQHESPFGMNSPRRPGLLGVVCGLVVFGIAGSLWFAYPKLKDHDPSRAQWESVHKSVDALGGRLDQQKSKLTEWSNNQDQLRDQIAAFRREMRSRIETARKQANRSAEELFDRAQKQEQTDTQEASAKLARLELSRDADQTQIAQLQEDLARTRQEAAQQAAALNEVRQQIAENGASAEQKLASLQATEDRDRRDVDTINDKLAVRRVDLRDVRLRTVAPARVVREHRHQGQRRRRSEPPSDRHEGLPEACPVGGLLLGCANPRHHGACKCGAGLGRRGRGSEQARARGGRLKRFAATRAALPVFRSALRVRDIQLPAEIVLQQRFILRACCTFELRVCCHDFYSFPREGDAAPAFAPAPPRRR